MNNGRPNQHNRGNQRNRGRHANPNYRNQDSRDNRAREARPPRDPQQQQQTEQQRDAQPVRATHDAIEARVPAIVDTNTQVMVPTPAAVPQTIQQPVASAPRMETPRVETPRFEAPRVETPRAETPRFEPARAEVETVSVTSSAPQQQTQGAVDGNVAQTPQGERKPRPHFKQRRYRRHPSSRPRSDQGQSVNKHALEGEDIYSNKNKGGDEG